MWAAAERHPDVVRLLVEAGADLQAHTKKGFTALHFAAREGRSRKRRANCSPRAWTSTFDRSRMNCGRRIAGEEPPAPDVACQARRRLRVRLEARLSGDSLCGQHAAARGDGAGHVPLALFLLEQGADPNVLDAGFTPLHWASATGKAASRIRFTASPTR